MYALKSLGKFILLTALFLVIYTFGAQLFLPDMSAQWTAEPGPLTPPFDFILFGAANVLVLWAVIRSSTWGGWRLMVGCCLPEF